MLDLFGFFDQLYWDDLKRTYLFSLIELGFDDLALVTVANDLEQLEII